MTHLIRTYVRSKAFSISNILVKHYCNEACVPTKGKSGRKNENVGKMLKSIFSSNSKPKQVKVYKKVRRSLETPRKSNQALHQIAKLDLKNVRSITGVSVSPFVVGWAKIDVENSKLLDFGSYLIQSDNEKLVVRENYLYQLAKQLKKNIPKSDLYIMEYFTTLRSGVSKSLHGAQLLAMMVVMLNENSEDENKNIIFFQERSVIDSLYDLTIDSERVSAGQKLQRIFGESGKFDNIDSDVNLKIRNLSLKLNTNFLNMIFGSRTTDANACGVALFLALAFIELHMSSIVHSKTSKRDNEKEEASVQ